MVNLEQVEKLRQYGDITYDQAKRALEDAGGDILEAIIILEKEGLINKPQNGGYHSSKNEGASKDESSQSEKTSSETEDEGRSFSELVEKFFAGFGKLVKRGNQNHFQIAKDGEVVSHISLTILVLLLVFAFWLIVPLAIVGLFFGYSYSFKGPDLGKEGVNKVMDSAAEAVDKIKKESGK